MKAMNTTRSGLALVVAVALGMLLSPPVAFAGFTLLEKDFVGGEENLNKVGGGDASSASDDAARHAGSANTIAEGPPPGRSEPEDAFPDRTSVFESFQSAGALQVIGAESVNGFPVFQNIPTCPDPVGTGLDQLGKPAYFTWAIEVERPVVSDLQVQICLDIRKCQEEDDRLGASMTPSMVDFRWGRDNYWEAPTYVKIHHEPGPINPIYARDLPNIVVPGLYETPLFDGLPPLGPTESPEDFEKVLFESVAFIGRDCITKWIPNDGWITVGDRIHVTVGVPESIRVRVRASQDSAALCYLGTPLPGECDATPGLCGL